MNGEATGQHSHKKLSQQCSNKNKNKNDHHDDHNGNNSNISHTGYSSNKYSLDVTNTYC